MSAPREGVAKQPQDPQPARPTAWTRSLPIGVIHPEVRRAVIRGQVELIRDAAAAGVDLSSALELALQLPATRTEVLEFLCNDARVAISADAIAFALARPQLKPWVEVLRARYPQFNGTRSVKTLIEEQLCGSPDGARERPPFCVPAVAKAVDLASGAALKTLQQQDTDLSGALTHALFHDRAPHWLINQMLYELEIPVLPQAVMVAIASKTGTVGHHWASALAGLCQPGLNVTKFFERASPAAMRGLLRNENYAGPEIVLALARAAKPRAASLAVLRYAIGKHPQVIERAELLAAAARWKEHSLTCFLIRRGAPISPEGLRALARAGETRSVKLALSMGYVPTGSEFEAAVREGAPDALGEMIEAYLKAGAPATRGVFNALAERWSAADNWEVDGQSIFRKLVKPLPRSYQKALTRMVIEVLEQHVNRSGRCLTADLQWLTRYAPQAGDAWRADSTYSLGVYSLARG